MGVAEQLIECWKGKDPNTAKVSDFVRECRERLSDAFEPGHELDPLDDEKAQRASNECGMLANVYRASRAEYAGLALLQWAWCKFGSVQQRERQRVYRAGLSMYLAQTCLARGETGAALRWALHTQADDLMGRHSQGGGAGREMLSIVLGMSDQELAALKDVADSNLQQEQSDTDTWASPFGFCENVVLQLSLDRPHAAHLFTMEPSVIQFPLSPGYYSALFRNAARPQPNARAKGAAYEDIASYLFTLIPGWIPRRNLVDVDQVHEHDLVVTNVNQTADLTTELLGRHFLVECKNWDDPVGVADVGYFLYRMHLTHARFGVIFAKTGLTPKKGGATAAKELIRRAFHEDGSLCVVVTEEDLSGLGNEDAKFWPMLLERIETLRFGAPTGKRKDSRA
jgi:hypothetical protein